MSDESKSREELLEELRALREKVGDASTETDGEASSDRSGGWTRREAIGTAAWVAPVILSVSLSGSSARAQAPRGTTPATFPMPTGFPSAAPTRGLTFAPTNQPTGSSPPTIPTSPPSLPTQAPTPVVPVELQSFDID